MVFVNFRPAKNAFILHMCIANYIAQARLTKINPAKIKNPGEIRKCPKLKHMITVEVASVRSIAYLTFVRTDLEGYTMYCANPD